MAGGRPTKFNKLTEQERLGIEMLYRKGATDKEVATFLSVSEQTINNWKNAQPKFFEALKDWKCEADNKVERALYQRAIGYTTKEERIFNDGPVTIEKQYPPDPTSMIFWLKNRKSVQWRDKHDIAANTNINIIRKVYEKSKK